MRPGSVFVDVSIDQGGMGETSRPTSHSQPTYVEEGIIHFCVPNIPGSVPATSTIALTNVTLPCCLKLTADPIKAMKADPGLALGANTWDGHITCEPVAQALGREWKAIEELI
jgi:alanine dehydrogenase